MGFETWTKEELQALRKLHPGGAKPRPSTVRTMTEVERAWVGAFIEADGFASVRRRPGHTDNILLGVTQVAIEPIALLLRLTGVGSIQWSGRIWSWIPWAMKDSKAITVQCAPYSWKLQWALEEV